MNRREGMSANTEIERTESGSIKGKGGRPPGSPNKATLVKEAIKSGMEDVLMTEGIKVFMATVQAAVGIEVKDKEGNLLKNEQGHQIYEGGSDACKKMILDRIAPLDDKQATGKDKFNINITVSGMEAKIGIMDEIDAEYEEINQED